jgi:hypothetical protein
MPIPGFYKDIVHTAYQNQAVIYSNVIVRAVAVDCSSTAKRHFPCWLRQPAVAQLYSEVCSCQLLSFMSGMQPRGMKIARSPDHVAGLFSLEAVRHALGGLSTPPQPPTSPQVPTFHFPRRKSHGWSAGCRPSPEPDELQSPWQNKPPLVQYKVPLVIAASSIFRATPATSERTPYAQHCGVGRVYFLSEICLAGFI